MIEVTANAMAELLSLALPNAHVELAATRDWTALLDIAERRLQSASIGDDATVKKHGTRSLSGNSETP